MYLLMVRRKLWLGYLAAGLVVAVVYLRSGVPAVHGVLLTGLGVSSVLATLGAIVLWRPERRRFWLIVCAAQAAEAVGVALYYRHVLKTGSPPTPGSINDPFFVGFYVLFAVALIMLLRKRGSSRAAVLDAALLAVAGAVPTVLILIEPYIAASGLPFLGKAAQIVSALGDVVLAAVFLRLVSAGGRRSPASLLLFAAVPSFLASDVIWNWLTLLGNYGPGSWGDAGWLLAFIFTGAASLHPSMVGLEEAERIGLDDDERVRQPTLGRLYLLVLGAALLVSPGLHLAENLLGRTFGSLPVVGLLGALALLVLVRVAGTVRESERLGLEVAEQNERLLQLDRMKDELRQAQKMEAIGRLAGGVAHDFNNMLLAISGYGALALAEIEPEQGRVRHALEQVETAAGRAAALTSQLLSFSRQQVLRPQVLDINSLMNGLTDMLRPLLGSTIELQVDLHPRAGSIEADPGQIEQVITNLVVNSRDAMPGGGRITIATAPADPTTIPATLAPGHYLALSVTDTGEGMDEETLSRALDPFFTTKEQGKGTGLGLATVHGIVTQSGGQIRIDSRPGGGTEIAIFLPCAEATAPAASSIETPTALARGNETILLVEDDQVVQSLLLDILARHGYQVVVASDGAQALEAAARIDLGPDLLVTDLTMPGMTGRDLACRLQSGYPGLPVIYISGHNQDAVLNEDDESRRNTFLQKPFTPNEILRTIRDVLNATNDGDTERRRRKSPTRSAELV
jgi:signal transduction histidine kinase/CheY-like chemotaxis protein